MDSKKSVQKGVDESRDHLDELIRQLPLMEPSPDFNSRVMNHIDPRLYPLTDHKHSKHHGGHMLVMLGVLAMIHTLTMDTIQWMMSSLAGPLQSIALFEGMTTIYQTVIQRMLHYVFVPYRMLLDLAARLSQGSQIWFAFGVLNLLLLLLLVHFAIQRIIGTTRGVER